MSETETVSLNLDASGFTEGASESIAAADALRAAFDKMDAAGQRIKDPKLVQADKLNAITAEMDQQAAIQAKIAAFDPQRTRELAKQEAIYKRMREDALGITAANEKAKRDAATDKQNKFNAAGDAAAMEKAGMVAGGAIAAGAAAVLTAAERLAEAGAQLVASGYKEAVETTSKHEVQGAVGNALGGDYDQTVHMALRMGIDPDEAWQQTKKLLNAKFESTEIPELLRTKAGMDLTGLDGDALLKKLETIKLGSKLGTKDVEGLKKLGIDVNEVYKQLAADTGESMEVVKAKVKAGTEDSAAAVRAIEKVAGDKFGGLADKLGDSVPALAARVKGEFGEMFDLGPGALDPIKEVLHNVLGVMEGGAGDELKGSFRDLFNALNETVLSQFQGEEGKQKIADFAHGASDSIHELAHVVRELKPVFDLITSAGGPALELLAMEFAGMGVVIEAVRDDIIQIEDAVDDLEAPFVAASAVVRDLVGDFDSIKAKLDGVVPDFIGTGEAVVDGVVIGIQNGGARAVQAAADLGHDVVQAARDAVGYGSPATEFIDTGDMSAEGLAIGMAGNPHPAAAGRQMAADALAGAQGGAAGSAGVGAASASVSTSKEGDVTVIIQVQGAGGGAAAEWQALQPEVERAVRRMKRDQLEGART